MLPLLPYVFSEETEFVSAPLDCQCDSQQPSAQAPAIAKIAYLITIHNERTAHDAVPLFRAIRSNHNLIFIHVDRKLDWDLFLSSPLHDVVTTCPCGAIVLFDSLHNAQWSAWSMNEPTFWGMQMAVSSRYAWDVFVNLSGDTLPVHTATVTGRLFSQALNGYNFVTSSICETGLVPTSVYHFPAHWHKRSHYTNNPAGDPVIEFVDDDGNHQSMTLTIYFGSQWMALQPDFCKYLVDSLQRPDSLPTRFKDYLVRTGRLMTDETFIPTLLMHVMPFNETIPKSNGRNGNGLAGFEQLKAIRYERMDEHVPTAFGYYPTQQRYEVPESSLADQPKPWGPYFLGVYDLADIIDSGALYVRKTSVHVDPNLVRLLPVSNTSELPYIEWPNEVQISPVPNWTKKIEEFRKAHDKRASAIIEEDNQDL